MILILNIEDGQCSKISKTLFHTFFLPFAFYAVYFLNYLVGWQTVKTLIRLLLKEQSDLGLHCLLMPFTVIKKKTFGNDKAGLNQGYHSFSISKFKTFHNIPDIFDGHQLPLQLS